MHKAVCNEDTKVRYTVTFKCYCLAVVYELVIKENLAQYIKRMDLWPSATFQPFRWLLLYFLDKRD